VGHGEQVSEMSAWLHDTLKRNMNRYDTDAIFSEVNGHVSKRGFQALTTAACFTYDAKKARLNYCYAGHPPILHYRHATGQWEALEPPNDGSGVRNISFGVTPEAKYDVGECQLETGDMLLLYSDGLTEARDAEQVLFGESRLLDCLKQPSKHDCAELIESLVQSIHAHTGKSPLDHDDVTVLAFRVGEPLSGSILRIALRNRLRRWELQRQARAV
ncbi:MAG: PP2C family protein-serine/threonine phosphatase, partial [FCB group bacterium]|jgi:sigma-B regulation protein RsbU (phosphoserine phosphatase)|nr:PP2C family protein-serine/threonine phosphatase [FCB group bacterium]